MNGNDYRKELAELAQHINSKEDISMKIKHLEDEAWNLEKKLNELKKEADKEQADVSNLEKMGFSKLFFEIINKYNIKLEKEKREAMLALAKYETAKKEYDDVNRDLDKMRVELLKINSSQRIYDEKYAEYRKYLISIHSRESDALLLMEAKIKGLYSRNNDLLSGLAYCEMIKSLCSQVKSEVKDARFWNNLDLFIRRSYLVYEAKYDSLDSGQQKISEIQVYLNKLRSIVSTSIEIPNLLRTPLNDNKFSDAVYSNLITHGDIDDNIRSSVSEINMVESLVDEIYVEIQHQSEKTKAKIADFEEQKEELIKNSNL